MTYSNDLHLPWAVITRSNDLHLPWAVMTGAAMMLCTSMKLSVVSFFGQSCVISPSVYRCRMHSASSRHFSVKANGMDINHWKQVALVLEHAMYTTDYVSPWSSLSIAADKYLSHAFRSSLNHWSVTLYVWLGSSTIFWQTYAYSIRKWFECQVPNKSVVKLRSDFTITYLIQGSNSDRDQLRWRVKPHQPLLQMTCNVAQLRSQAQCCIATSSWPLTSDMGKVCAIETLAYLPARWGCCGWGTVQLSPSLLEPTPLCGTQILPVQNHFKEINQLARFTSSEEQHDYRLGTGQQNKTQNACFLPQSCKPGALVAMGVPIFPLQNRARTLGPQVPGMTTTSMPPSSNNSRSW